MPRHGQIRVFSLFLPIIMAPGGKKVNKMHSKHGSCQMWTRWCDAELVLHWCGVITQSMACNYLTRIKNWPLEQITRQRRGALQLPGLVTSDQESDGKQRPTPVLARHGPGNNDFI